MNDERTFYTPKYFQKIEVESNDEKGGKSYDY